MIRLIFDLKKKIISAQIAFWIIFGGFYGGLYQWRLQPVRLLFYTEEEIEVDETAETVAVQYPGLKEGPKLTLYISPWCPYCKRVMQYLNQKGIEVPVKDTSDLGNREELIQIGGKKQVPCLVIDGKALYESNDIIKWFEGQRI